MPGERETLRWLDLGHLGASELHVAYQALASLRRADAPSLLILASADRHLSLGASQAAALELEQAACASLAVIQRPLGGGLVWVEPAHLNYFLLATPTAQRRRPEELLEWVAPTIQAAYARYGLPVELVARQEFRCRGRRIGSTGAATIGNSLVLAGSFLLHSDWCSFVASVAAPTAEFRTTLGRALRASLTSWQEELVGSVVPSHAELKTVWKMQLQAQGWLVEADDLRAEEHAALKSAELEAVDWESGGRRRVRDGIKLRANTFLTEKHWPEGWLRIWTEDGCYREVEGNLFPPELCWALSGVQARSPLLPSLMAGYLGASAGLWLERLEGLAVWSDQ
ncbi:lipoate--protein ligase family protein [Acidithiobacillus sp. IBUN Pt1247-S3]|uniref:lipoyl protein ligase domain-containing protein n=1 Tax=Acidithiobacillus sp. IBUN Pt1247-S3 TaxID=3166642 RepID=UPI0034E3D9FD